MKNYQYLNLEQKMLRIRRKMPTLLKRFYNDEADYDFATLDDIYEAMTPALNKYGVNFDIVREIPTQYDESGHQTYLVSVRFGIRMTKVTGRKITKALMTGNYGNYE